jgi:hypothetical protein
VIEVISIRAELEQFAHSCPALGRLLSPTPLTEDERTRMTSNSDVYASLDINLCDALRGYFVYDFVRGLGLRLWQGFKI